MDDFTRHEALHTIHILRDSLANYVIEHTYFESEKNKEFNKLIETAFDALCDAYQLCDEENENE